MTHDDDGTVAERKGRLLGLGKWKGRPQGLYHAFQRGQSHKRILAVLSVLADSIIKHIPHEHKSSGTLQDIDR